MPRKIPPSLLAIEISFKSLNISPHGFSADLRKMLQLIDFFTRELTVSTEKIDGRKR